MSGRYEKAIRQSVPQAQIAFDPFHAVRLGQRAVDQVRRDEWNAHERSHTPKGRWIKGTRWSLLKAPDKQSVGQLALLGEVQQANKAMFRAFLMKEELRLLYQLDEPALAPAHLDAWLAWASRSRLEPFIKLARTIPATATTLVAVIGDVRRFPTSRHLVGYLGLHPTIRQSGNAPGRHGRVSKEGSAAARHVLV